MAWRVKLRDEIEIRDRAELSWTRGDHHWPEMSLIADTGT